MGQNQFSRSGDNILPNLLRGVHQDLLGFLTALHPWAQDIAADLADPLVTAVDRHLQISTPLDI